MGEGECEMSGLEEIRKKVRDRQIQDILSRPEPSGTGSLAAIRRKLLTKIDENCEFDNDEYNERAELAMIFQEFIDRKLYGKPTWLHAQLGFCRSFPTKHCSCCCGQNIDFHNPIHDHFVYCDECKDKV